MSKRPSRPRRGLGRARSVCLTAFAACAVSAIGVSSAQAAPVPFNATVNYGWADLGSNFSDAPLLLGTQSATVSGQIDDGTGVISGADLTFPQLTLPLGANAAQITLDDSTPNSITGSLNPVTGALTLNTTLKADVDVLLGGTTNIGGCTYDPITLNFSTGNTNPHPGIPFNGAGGAAGPGGVAANGTLPAGVQHGPSNQCTTLNTALGSNAIALWLGHNAVPTDGVPVGLHFENTVLDLGILKDQDILNPPDSALAPATLTGNSTSTANSTADVLVANGDWDFPTFHGTLQGIPLDVDLLQDADFTGTFDTANGQMDWTFPITADINIGSPLNSHCQVTPSPVLQPSTSNQSPWLGVPYTGLDGTGAMVAAWSTLPPAVPISGDCSLIDGVDAGPGGMFISQGDLVPVRPGGGGGGGGGTTTTPVTTPTGNPAALKKCKKKAKKIKDKAKRKKAIKKCKKKFG